ncbi:MAG: DUF5658 family protein [Candidatus Cloacimonetes bacterium]|nr:DUF5658 family protein [Candidatus Cloacimonadota bacterium]MCK9331765.1 DUF5658 family protein [Candidatus Cloacimonadota bacterium]MDD4231728.1 DUF5658 family protein [Candidatus Cloacimonadota bacterium]
MMEILIVKIHSIKLFWVLIHTFILLNVFDAHSTYLVTRPHYFYRERNPVARWIFKKLGIPRGIIVFKCGLLAVLIPAMIYYSTQNVFTINIVLIVSSLIFLLVVLNNYRVYKRIHKRRKT